MKDISLRNNKNIAVLLIGGTGTRLGSDKPKQFIEIAGKPLFFFPLERFIASPLIDGVLIVSASDWVEKTKDLVSSKEKIIDVIPGGPSRAESARNAILHLSKLGYDGETIVLIADGDRPNLEQRYIEESIEAASKYGAAIVAIEATDSLAKMDNDTIVEYIPRNGVLTVQTPQTFKLDILMEAYKTSDDIDAFTDEGSLVLNLTGTKPRLIKGSTDNIKITTKEDLEAFERSESWKRK